jgi:hypothetical protein
MHDHQIAAGFSDIKRQFLVKTGSKKTMSNFDLWFSYKHEFLIAHDDRDHSTSWAIALFNNRKWRLFLVQGSLGANLVSELMLRFDRELPDKVLNDTYLLCAHLTGNRQRF